MTYLQGRHGCTAGVFYAGLGKKDGPSSLKAGAVDLTSGKGLGAEIPEGSVRLPPVCEALRAKPWQLSGPAHTPALGPLCQLRPLGVMVGARAVVCAFALQRIGNNHQIVRESPYSAHERHIPWFS
jgi:hypothetical protein